MAREKKKGVGHVLRTAADALRRKRAVAAVYTQRSTVHPDHGGPVLQPQL